MKMKNEFDFQSLKKKIEFATKKCNLRIWPMKMIMSLTLLNG